MLKLMAFTLAAAFLFAIASIIIGRFTATPPLLPLHRRSLCFLNLSQSGDRPGQRHFGSAKPDCESCIDPSSAVGLMADVARLGCEPSSCEVGLGQNENRPLLAKPIRLHGSFLRNVM